MGIYCMHGVEFDGVWCIVLYTHVTKKAPKRMDLQLLLSSSYLLFVGSYS